MMQVRVQRYQSLVVAMGHPQRVQKTKTKKKLRRPVNNPKVVPTAQPV